MEIIAVDDGSTDTSHQILADFATRYSVIKVITRKNGGLSIARNTGITNATGEWITFLDADDILLPGALSTLLDLQQATGADVAGGRILSFRNVGLSLHHLISSHNNKIETSGPVEAIERMLYQTWYTHASSACAKIYRYSLFQNVRFREGIQYEDLELFPRLLIKANKIAATEAYVYGYRENPQSFTHTWSEKRPQIISVTESMAETDPFIGNKRLVAALNDRRFSAALNILMLIDKYKVYDEALEKRCVEIIKKGKRSTLLSSRARLKNRLGAFVAYFGPATLRALNKCVKMV